MALTRIYDNAKFTALSTDVVDNQIEGLKTIGAKVYLTDTKVWKITNDDLTLSDYIINSDLQVGDIEIGAVELKDSTTNNRAVIDSDGKLSVKEGDGDNVTIGAKADSKATDSTSVWSVISLLKGIWFKIGGALSLFSTTLQDDAQTTGDGTDADVTGLKTIVISITGANVTTSTITFQGSLDGTNFFNMVGVRQADLSFTLALSTTTVQGATPECWEFDVSGLTKFRTAISVLTGTSATITIVSNALA